MPKHSTATATCTADRLTPACRFLARLHYKIKNKGIDVTIKDEDGFIVRSSFIPFKQVNSALLSRKLEETGDIWKEYPRTDDKKELDKITANTTKHWLTMTTIITLTAG